MKTLIVIDTYPSSGKKYQELIDCIDSLKPTGLDILVTSHYPVGQDVQQKINHYIYDSNNLLIPSYQKNFWGNEYFFCEYYLPYHGPAICLNWHNGFNFAKLHGYEFVVYISSDCVFSLEDSDRLVELIKLCNENQKKGFVFNPQEWIVHPCDQPEQGKFIWETLIFGFSVEDFLLNFSPPNNLDNYNLLPCQGYLLEINFYIKLQPLKKEIHVISSSSSQFFNKSKIDLSSSVTFFCDLIKINSPEPRLIFLLLLGKNIQNMTVKLFIDSQPILDNLFHAHSWFYKEFTTSGNQLKIEYSSDDGISGEKNYILDTDLFVEIYKKPDSFTFL